MKIERNRLPQWPAPLLVLLAIACFATAPTIAQTSTMGNLQSLVCHYSPQMGEISLALMALSTKTDPRQSYSLRDELEVRLTIDSERSTVIERNSLKVAVLGDYRSMADRKYTLFRFNIVMDESTSIEDPDLEKTRRIITSFLDKIPVTFEVQLIRFSGQVSVATGFTNDIQTFLAALNAPRMRGGTAFYDAFDQGMKELVHAPGPPMPLRFTIAFTDGEDTSSSRFRTFDDFKRKIQMQAEHEQIFMFVAGIGGTGGSSTGIQHALLEQVPGKMGFYYPLSKVPDVDKLFEQVANALDRTYIVRIPVVSSYQGTKTIDILKRKPSGNHDTIERIHLPASCIP